MIKIGRIFVYILVVLVVVISGALCYIKIALPNVGAAPDLKVEITPQRVERGKYLAMNVTVCIDCHSKRDWAKFSGPLDLNSIGTGGENLIKLPVCPGQFTVQILLLSI